MYVFISHSSKNEEPAEKICSILENHNHKCFLAARDIRAGREYAEEIVNGIDKSDAVVVLLSEEANKSPHVLREIERAVSHKIPIIIYKLEEVELTKSMEYFLMTHQWMSRSKDDSYENILDCVEDIAGNNGSAKAGSKGQEETKSHRSRVCAVSALAASAVIILAAIGFLIYGILSRDNKDDIKDKGQERLPVSITNGGTNNDKEEEDSTKNEEISKLSLGDTVSLGTYLDKEISWRVLKISDDGREAVLVSRDIITMKAFDAAEGGEYNKYDGKDYWKQNTEADTDMELQIKVRGNSDWSLSNIRTWLNSDSETVSYEGQAPLAGTMSDKKNGYNTEAGFLNGFTGEELSAIKTTVVETPGNALAKDNIIKTEDRVFLLSRTELKWFEEAGMSVLAKPTEEARIQDATDWYEAYSVDIGMENFYWLLREPVEYSSSKIYCVGDGYTEENMFERQAGVEGFGIRPAITVDVNKLIELQK